MHDTSSDKVKVLKVMHFFAYLALEALLGGCYIGSRDLMNNLPFSNKYLQCLR